MNVCLAVIMKSGGLNVAVRQRGILWQPVVRQSSG